MKKLMLIVLLVFVYCSDNKSTPPVSERPGGDKPTPVELLENRFSEKIDSVLPAAKMFTAANGYDESLFFFADLSMHSGVERFAVVSMDRDSVMHKGLVAHGVGGNEWAQHARYSNVPNSLCSSVGRYRIGQKYNGMFGKSYKLHGLDKTNSKAFERFIVLHGYECVPDERPYPQYLCNSKGCPMVSNGFMDVLSNYIDKSKKPVLLWIIG